MGLAPQTPFPMPTLNMILSARHTIPSKFASQDRWPLNANDVQATVAFCETLSTYFDSVLVNADNPAVAQNRRSFIKLVNDHFGQVGDWLKLTK